MRDELAEPPRPDKRKLGAISLESKELFPGCPTAEPDCRKLCKSRDGQFVASWVLVGIWRFTGLAKAPDVL